MSRFQLAFSLVVVAFATGCIDIGDLAFDGGTTVSQTYASVVLSDDPLAYWPLDELTNGVVSEDASGNGLDAFATTDGVVTGDVTGVLGAAVSLSDRGELFVSTPHPLSFPTGSYTLEAWVRLEGDPADLWTCNLDDGYITGVGANDVYHKRYDSGGDMNETVDLVPVSFVDFRHLVLVYDSEAGGGAAQWFLDGAPGTPPIPTSLSWTAQETAFQLARGAFASDGALVIDEVAVYDVALRADRIEAHYRCATEQDCD